MSDDLNQEERALLAAWSATPPPLDFPERVLARLPSAKGRGALRVGLGVGLAAAVLLGAYGLHFPRRGEHVLLARTTVLVGDRATAVGEAGSELSYQVGLLGAAQVVQSAGDVFYRVERGGPFVVQTPAGAIEVTGTSFRVEVEMIGNKAAAGLGAGAGVVAASLVWVTVYEGAVRASGPSGALRVEAGDRAELRAGAEPTLLGPASAARRPGVAASAADPAPGRGPGGSRPTEETLESLRAERARLVAQVGALQAQLEEAGAPGKAPSDREMLDLDAATLARMADRCELRWDTIGVGPEPPTLSAEWAAEAELSDDEREVVDRVFAREHQALVGAIAQAYREVTGDDSGGLSTSAMLMELEDKVPEGELKAVFQRLSAERAGRVPGPVDPANVSPVERVFRALTQSGDVVESALAKELGPEVARRLRHTRGGWSSKSRSSYGCPP